MKHWLPSKRALGIYVLGILLAMGSLPDVPNLPACLAHHRAATVHAGSAVPTLAVPADGSQTNKNGQSSRKPAQQRPKSQVKQWSKPKTYTTKPAPTPKSTAPKQPPQRSAPPAQPRSEAPKVRTPQPAPVRPVPVPVPPAQRPPANPPQPHAQGVTPGPGSGDGSVPDGTALQTPSHLYSPYVPWPTARLRIRVIDGRTQKPLSGAEVVIIETEQRLTTGADGFTPWADVPIIRNPRYRPMVAELHGQLGAIAYKNGYRDSVHLGIRMHEGIENETTIWMYKLGPGDRRIEPVLYQVPYHRIWLIELADKFRSKSQPGEGPERP